MRYVVCVWKTERGGKPLNEEKRETKALYLIPVPSHVIMPVPREGPERNPSHD